MSSQAVFPRDASRESPHFGPSPGRGRVSLEGLSTGGAVHEPLDPISVIRPRVAGNKPRVSGITSAEAMSRGRALYAQKSLDLAALCFEEALQIDPCNISAYFNSAQCAFDLGKFAIARQHLEMVIEIDPHMGLAHLALGQIYLQDGMIESAMASSECALKLLADDERATAFRATVLQFSGDGKAAWKLVRAMIDRGIKSPQLVAFHAELAFKNNRSETAIKLLDEVLAMPGLSSWEEALLRYSAAGLLDRLGRYDEAFAQANRANFLRQPSFNMVKHEREIDNLIAYFSSQRLRCLPKASYRDAKPVFVVGMPRSGTSLTEQILASHPDVYGAGELDFISRVFEGTLDMLGSPVSEYPGCLDRLSVDRADGMAQIYLEPLKALSPNSMRIVDKMPLNFLQLGLIALLLPEAKIIHCRRDPLDTCLSCFLTDFSVGHQFKYNLKDLGSFHRLHDRLMAHWKSVLEIPILDVVYENVVANPEAEARRMVDFIGLPWNDRCLHFHETQRPVVTASVQQVRQPIYSSSVQRWRHYESHLGPLQAALRGE